MALHIHEEGVTCSSLVTSFVAVVESLCYQEELRSSHLSRLTELIDRDNQLLWWSFGSYDSLWEWTLHQKCADEVASHLLQTRGYLMPINTVNISTGDSVVTNSKNQVLDPKVLKILLDSDEKLDYINEKTGESFLHAVAKLRRKPRERKRAMDLLMELIQEMENPLLEVFQAGEVNFPNPDLKNRDDMTALHLSLETGDISLATVLVQTLGANWRVRPSERFSSVYALDKAALAFISECDKSYGLRSNNIEANKKGGDCMVCYEPMEVPQKVYWMKCCGALIHVECLMTYLARAPRPHCMFCNMLIDKWVRYQVPDTIYKKKWEPYITREAALATEAAKARRSAMDLVRELNNNDDNDEEEERGPVAATKKEESGMKYSSADETVWVKMSKEEIARFENHPFRNISLIIRGVPGNNKRTATTIRRNRETSRRDNYTSTTQGQPSHSKQPPPVFDDDDDDDFVMQEENNYRIPLNIRGVSGNSKRTATTIRRNRETSRRDNYNYTLMSEWGGEKNPGAGNSRNYDSGNRVY